MTVQNIFKIERTKLGFTTRQVGERVGVSPMAISITEDVKRTQISVKTDLCKKLCVVYGLNYDDIIKKVFNQRTAESIAKIKARKMT
jgi:transcriptional regulator with XRE-family HTH domain